MSKAPTADSIYEGFTSKPLMIRGDPSYQTLVELRDCIYANASELPSPLGGGKYGYLGALIPAADYIALPNAIAFVIPVDPGNILAVGMVGTANEIADAVHAHSEKLRQFVEYNVLMQALRKQIIESVEEKYIKNIRNKYTRYSAITPNEMLKHLFNNYGKVTPEDIVLNENRLNEPWEGTEPFENIVDRVEECVQFAIEAERPYTADQILDWVIRIVPKTGIYQDEMKEWKKKVVADKTWKNLKAFMVDAQKTNRENKLNNKQMGYGLAAEQLELLANLMSATASSNNNSNNNGDNKMLTKILNRFESFEKNVNERFKAISKPVGDEKPPWVHKDTGSYCHTHGYKVNKKHNSLTCRTKAPGHKDEATRANNMGGSQVGKPTSA
jgi:hypothetical protein